MIKGLTRSSMSRPQRCLSKAEDRSGAEAKAVHRGSTDSSGLVIRASDLVGKPVRQAHVHSTADRKRQARIGGKAAMAIVSFDARQSLSERRGPAAGPCAQAHATAEAEQRIDLLASRFR